MNIEPVTVFQIPNEVVRVSEDALQRAGRDGRELFVLWTGTLNGQVFRVEHTYVPTQRSYRGDSGLCVRVEGQELHRLNQWLYEHNQVLAIQIHTHPDEAYHSDTDNTYPIMTNLGGLSLVVPQFCRGGLGSPGSVVYRLRKPGWEKLTAEVVRDLLQMS